jgi:branched-chain amino acid transport system ATP-binding protein
MSTLEVRALTAGYGAARVLHGVDVRVGQGEVVGLAGRNGAGKSTLLRAISGVIPRQAEVLAVDGHPLPRTPAGVARRGVVQVPEGRGMLRDLTALDNIRLGALAIGSPCPEEWLEEVLARVPRLRPLLHRRAGNLSGGEQQLVAVARAIAARPRFVLADELSLGLSPRAADEVFALASDICADLGVGLLVVDQNVRTLVRSCARLYILRRGCAEELTTAELTSGEALERAYI